MPIKRQSPRHLLIVFSFLILTVFLASCALPVPTNIPTSTPPSPTPLQPFTSTPTNVSIVIPPTETATNVLALPSATPENTPTPTPTVAVATTQPLPTNSIPTGSIAFTPGTTAGVVDGTIQPGQVLTYTLGAAQSQAMVLIVGSTNNDVTLGVLAPNGSVLLNNANKFIRWQTLLPQTGLYTIQLYGGATAENFTLTAKIPEVVNFALGTSSIAVSGTTLNGYLHAYSFACAAGQTMTASLNVASTTAYIDVYGVSSGTLLSAASKLNSWTGILPQNDVYIIEVVPTGGLVINYTLTVSVTSAGGTTPSGSIVFASGTTMGTVTGTVDAGQVKTYTINAGAGLPMILDVASGNNDVTLGVIQPDGTVLLNPANKWIHWQWTLPETGLYRIQVIGGATTEAYSLTARIPVRVNFAPGATSATLSNSTVNGTTFSYALKCAANQTMAVTLTAPAGTAYLDIFGVSSGTLLSASSQATSWTVVLPKSEDYVVEVIPVGGQVVNFALTVSVTSPLSTTSTNISFTPGTTAGVLQGTIQPGQVVSYTLTAAQWQPMILSAESSNYDVTLGVFEPNGNAVVPPGNKWVHWQGLLPQSEVYTIQLYGGPVAGNYTLTVKLPVRINFVLGQSSVTLNGTNVNGYVFSYAFKANANQTMTVTLNQPATVAYIDVVGIATGALLSPQQKANEWEGVLPQYQDYIIEVIPRQGQLMSYTLTVTIH
jgi:hypothetical protein